MTMKKKRQPIPDDIKNKVTGPIATLIAERVDAARHALEAKGYDNPKISIGLETMGGYGPIIYAHINLSSPKCWMREVPYNKKPTSIEALLDEIDASVELVPTLKSIQNEEDEALTKLTPHERQLLGVSEFEINMRRRT